MNRSARRIPAGAREGKGKFGATGEGAMARGMRPEVFHGLTALGIAALGSAATLGLFRPSPITWYHVLGAWLVAVNLVAFAYYGYDKSCARASSRRVPELVLHGLALAGGSFGAY